MKVIVYNRKSTKDKEDQQVLSIQGQKEENAKRVLQGNHDLIAECEEEQTAKKPGRSLFNEMMTRIEAGEAEAIVCWRLNRLARNPIDGGRIQWLLQQGVIKAIITSEKIYLPTDNVIQMSVEFGMATQYSIDLSKEVKRGMHQKVRDGWKPGRPALGYMRDDAGVKGRKTVKEDPERFALVKMMWDELLSKAFTVPQIWQRAVDRGLTQPGSRFHPDPKPLHLSTLYKIFTNTFYYGEFEWDGQIHEGKHKSMITMSQYDDAQIILGRDGKPRLHKNENPYAGLVHCGECGAMIVMDRKTKFNQEDNAERQYHYFRCSKRRLGRRCCQKGSLDRKKLEEQLWKIIADVELPQSIIEWSLTKLQCSHEDTKLRYQRALEILQEREGKAEKKMDDLIDLRLENPAAFTPESFERKRKGIEAELRDIKKKRKDREAAAKTWRDGVLDGVAFLEGVRERFEKEEDQRLSILQELGQRLELKDKVLTFQLADPYFSLKEARDAMEAAVGRLEPLNCGLDKVQKDIFEIAISVWSGIRESNPRLKLGKLAYYHCTNPA